MATAADRMLYELAQSSDQIGVTDLISILDRYPGIKTLSLDCFDTLLWRKTVAPADVFYQLQEQPGFSALGFTAALRIHAETRARQIKAIQSQATEVKLRDIYLCTYPELSASCLEQLASEELSMEMEACFALPQIIELMRTAHQRNLKIIIVSDTYFEEQQLRQLLGHCLPTDVMAAIQKIYCSCDYGKSKANGLFATVLQSSGLTPDSILHFGDNTTADYVAPRLLKINALHFSHTSEPLSALQRLQTIAASVLNPAIHHTQPLFNPFHSVLCSGRSDYRQPETLVGYASLGPIMYTFARFICDELQHMQAQGKKAKALFLMRDGYLPAQACDALMDTTVGKRIRISRFAAYAASFRTQSDVENYLAHVIQSQRFRDIANQLLLPEKVAEPIIKVAERSPNPAAEFTRLIQRQDTLRIIVTKSAEYRARLLSYLEKEADIQPGDTLVLIDLGYHGTVQQLLTPLLNEKNIDVTGRYLIALRTPDWESNRRGLLDPSWCDDKMLKTLVAYIAMLEQLSTSTEHSVIGYEKNGDVIFSETTLGEHQHTKLSHIQTECLRFIHDAKKLFASMNTTLSFDMMRAATMAELGRMIFFPTEIELNYLQSFQFDLNLGTKDVLTMFDPSKGLAGLHRRGIFFIEKNSKNMRMNYPAELRAAGFELTLALMTQQRFSLDIKLQDMLPRQQSLPMVLRRGNETHHTMIESQATFDGYYAAWTPIGKGDIEVSIRLGQHFDWIQIESAEVIRLDAFIAQQETGHSLEAWQHLTFQHMHEKSGRLFECSSDDSTMTLTPALKLPPADYIFRFVYRPIAARTRKTPEQPSSPQIAYKFSLQ